MPDAAWKRFERRLAEDWGAEARTPLSGEHSRHTSADTLHETIYIEAKLMADAPLWAAYRDLRQRARRYEREPLMILDKPGSGARHIFIFTPDDGRECVSVWIDENPTPPTSGGRVDLRFGRARGEPHAVIDHRVSKKQPYWSLMMDTVDAARGEGKVPVVCVSQKRCPGYLVLLPVGDWGTEGSS